jgi:hypothetical protein
MLTGPPPKFHATRDNLEAVGTLQRHYLLDLIVRGPDRRGRGGQAVKNLVERQRCQLQQAVAQQGGERLVSKGDGSVAIDCEHRNPESVEDDKGG